MNLDFNFNGKTLLKNWWKIVRDNFTAVSDGFEDHRTNPVIDHPDQSIYRRHLTSDVIGNKELADGSVITSKLGASCVTSVKVANNAVRANHIANGVVSKEKLDANLTSVIDSFREHMDNPSQELQNNSVTWDKINISLRPFIRNFMTEQETYDYCNNDFMSAYPNALFLAFSSAYGPFSDAPPDTTAMPDGTLKYLLIVTNITAMKRVQIAINLANFNKYIRVVGTMAVPWTQWT